MNTNIINKFYSQDSLFNAIPWKPKHHWVQKNRHAWSEYARDLLFHSEAGKFTFDLTKTDILVRLYDRNEEGDIINLDKKDPTKLYCGKVLKIGELAFDLACFPFGASATYNDWVLFDIGNAERVDISNKTFYILNDLDIRGVIKDPSEIINNKIKDSTHGKPN